nr:serine acetyltransferase [Motilibacter aurantiacus]
MQRARSLRADAFAAARADIARYVHMLRLDGVGEGVAGSGRAEVLRAVAVCPGLQATLVYRFGRAVALSQPSSEAGQALRTAGRILHFALARLMEMTNGIRINEHADIGPGLHIAHHGTTIIGAVTMGANCNLTHSITLGRSSRRGEKGVPTLGDRVWIGPGAVVTGAISIGDDVVIGANAVVTRPLADRAVAYGIPARVTSARGSFDQVVYPGCDEDPVRLASMALRASAP